MRRLLFVGAAALAVAALTVAALGQAAPAITIGGTPHITRVFIPAIKEACTGRSGLLGADLGYRFDDAGALQTIDPGDGSVTGLPVTKLAALNACLRAYPVEAPELPPRDAYTRNLLYDYFSAVLRACLASRVDPQALPPMPTRADFIVRLYSWDPYRVLAPGRTLDDLLMLYAACPERPAYLEPDPPRVASLLETGPG